MPQAATAPSSSIHCFLGIFAFRVLKVILWRRIKGNGSHHGGRMSVENAFNDLGRARFFIKDNIKKMEVVQRR